MFFSEWIEGKYLLFLLIFSRITGLLQSAPFFQSRSLPGYFRAGLALFISLILTPLFGEMEVKVSHLLLFFLLVVRELIIGLLLGYVLNLAFAGIQLAGQLVEVPMGFGMVNILDPQAGYEVPIIGQLQHLTALWLFLLVDGHHMLFNLLVKSYQLLPLNAALQFKSGIELVIKAFSGMFWLGFQVALPVWGVIFLTDVGLGVLSRLIPQINVFIMGFPIKVALGLILLILGLPVFVQGLAQYFSPSGKIWSEAIRLLTLLGRGQ